MIYGSFGEGGEGYERNVPRMSPKRKSISDNVFFSQNWEGGIFRLQPSPPSPFSRNALVLLGVSVVKIGGGVVVMVKVDAKYLIKP